MISETTPYEKRFAAVNGKRVAYVESDAGDTVIIQLECTEVPSGRQQVPVCRLDEL
jgi:hypothetical protein